MTNSEIDPITGLPKELNVYEVLERETATRIKIYTKKSKFNKLVTVVEGLSGEELKKVAKELKNRLSCGGTDKNGVIELQGDHKEAAKKILLSLGYQESNIDVL